jgi:hypothetical protein
MPYPNTSKTPNIQQNHSVLLTEFHFAVSCFSSDVQQKLLGESSFAMSKIRVIIIFRTQFPVMGLVGMLLADGSTWKGRFI